MATYTQSITASSRSGSPTDKDDRVFPIADRRPYLVPAGLRKPAGMRATVELFPHESEDARITGSTRSLYRRLLALNLPNAELTRTPVAAAETRLTVVATRIA